MSCKFEIYKILKVGAASKSHCINRTEDWIVQKLENTFANEKDAVDFLRQSTKTTPEFILQAEYITDSDKREEFLTTFLSQDKYLIYRRYFIGKPPKSKIINQLLTNKINVVQL
jgi:hypothetical protein